MGEMAALTIATLVALVLSSGLLGALLLYGSNRRWALLWAVAATLPLAAVASRLVVRPAAFTLREAAGIEPPITLGDPLWYLVVLALLPPVTEELLKLGPLVVRPLSLLASGPSAALWLGFALGLGFGLGETVYLAYGLSAALPSGVTVGQFGGFITERLLISAAHAALSAIAVRGTFAGGRFVPVGILGAVALHVLVKLGGVMQQLGIISASGARLGLLLMVGVLAIIVLALVRANDPARVSA